MRLNQEIQRLECFPPPLQEFVPVQVESRTGFPAPLRPSPDLSAPEKEVRRGIITRGIEEQRGLLPRGLGERGGPLAAARLPPSRSAAIVPQREVIAFPPAVAHLAAEQQVLPLIGQPVISGPYQRPRPRFSKRGFGAEMLNVA